MSKRVRILALGALLFAFQVPAHAFQLHDLMSVRGANPIEVWRKMRPQDFIGAPTIWQIIV